MDNGWNDFFFGSSALQNYVSELFGVVVAVFIVDRVIRFRAKRRERPLRDMACVLVFEMVDIFIDKYLPAEHNRHGASGRSFGEYWANGGVYDFQDRALSFDKIKERMDAIERVRWQRINWPNSHDLSEQSRQSEEDGLKAVLRDVKQYGRDVEEFLFKHQGLLDRNLFQRLSAIRFEIAKGFRTYYEPLKITHASSFGVDIRQLLPSILVKSIEVSLYLEDRYGHKRKG